MPQTPTISRKEIRCLIRDYEKRAAPSKGWYQNIRFLPLLETRRTVLDIVAAGVRGNIRKEELVVSRMPRIDSARVIDIGCNAGLYSLEASCRGASFVLGVDRDSFRVQQANDVADVFRRLGRPVGPIQFKIVDDINNHLELVADKDVLIACCVLYHLGPLARLKAAVVESNVKTLILQGNAARCTDVDCGHRGDGNDRSGGLGDDVASLDGLVQFCASMGFSAVAKVKHAFPLVIATR